jgi:hypothetical protein
MLLGRCCGLQRPLGLNTKALDTNTFSQTLPCKARQLPLLHASYVKQHVQGHSHIGSRHSEPNLR